tara:strand:- start:2947 stop:4362 length:1416 start_codon:yes stop_codon:yes gene_type:complete
MHYLPADLLANKPRLTMTTRPLVRFAPLALILLLASCAESHDDNTVTGKGSIRAINAIAELNAVYFLIEETLLAQLEFKEASGTSSYDDLEYTFNFDTLLPGDTSDTRLISSTLQVDPEYEHTFILAGSYEDPEIILWQQFGRDWADEVETATENDTEVTLMEVSFGNLSNVAGSVDVYFEAPGTSPEFAVPTATISYGELHGPVELQSGSYQLVLTPAGDSSTVLFASDVLSVSAATSHLLNIMDDGGETTAEFSVHWVGYGIELFDINLQSEMRVVHAALGTDPVDVVIDGDFGNPDVSSLSFASESPTVVIEPGPVSINVTPAGDTGVFLAERDLTIAAGDIDRMYLIGYPGAVQAVVLPEERRTLATHARFQVFQGAARYASVDLYLVDETVDISLIGPNYTSFAYGTGTGLVSVEPGAYNLFVTESGTKNIIGGPYATELAANENYGVVIVDSANLQAVDVLDVDL